MCNILTNLEAVFDIILVIRYEDQITIEMSFYI